MAFNTNPSIGIETIVAVWLDHRKIEYLPDQVIGVAVVDFILPEKTLAWRIFGGYWHSGVEKTGTDVIQRELLSQIGYGVVDLQSDDIQEKIEETLTKALQGQEMLH